MQFNKSQLNTTSDPQLDPRTRKNKLFLKIRVLSHNFFHCKLHWEKIGEILLRPVDKILLLIISYL